MFISRTHLTATALVALALAPAAALAADSTSTPVLKSSPQMRTIDDHHAKLNFASDRLPRTAAGKIDAKISYGAGFRVTKLKATGKHGRDTTYSAVIASRDPMVNHQKFKVRFRLGDSPTVQRSVKLYAVGQHN